MRIEDFDYVARLLKECSGLVVSPDKSYVLESRLRSVAHTHQLADIEELVRGLRGRDEALVRAVMEATTTNESFFFRDIRPFDLLGQSILPALIARRAETRTLRVWSAACSSGQETYTMAMLLRELSGRLAGWKVEILGSDLSLAMLDKARTGLYSQFEVQRGLPIAMLMKYFSKRDESFQIDSALRAMVQFREGNLMRDLAEFGRFDVILCRYVLHHFDRSTAARVLTGFAAQMPGDGTLLLGENESTLGLCDAFKPMPGERGIFVKG